MTLLGHPIQPTCFLVGVVAGAVGVAAVMQALGLHDCPRRT